MKYSRFEDLPVWQAAVELKLHVDRLAQHPKVKKLRNWVDQIDRASLSISNNIAEGFERGSTNELLMFIYIARGSAGEVRSMLRYAARRPDLSDLKSQISDLIRCAESTSRQLRGWAGSLQNGDIKGQRHLTEESRLQYERDARAHRFCERIKADHLARFERPHSGDEPSNRVPANLESESDKIDGD